MSNYLENPFHPLGTTNSSTLAPRHSSPRQPFIEHQSLGPMSPPKSRSTSADESSVALVEDWRAYVQQLRSQFHGERSHLRADRDRMNEVIDGERELWERERILWNNELGVLKARILDLETQLSKAKISALNFLHHTQPTPTSQSSRSTSLDSSTSSNIPQESGRKADGNPFYAPASLNPTRSFYPNIAYDIRVDDLTTPRETPIIVTSKELTSSDFGKQTYPIHMVTDTPEKIQEAIDICHIQPELDSVAIRVSAVLPSFAAKVLSPQRTPPKISPGMKPLEAPQKLKDEIANLSSITKICNTKFASCLENKRSIMFAGHTPNHSLTKFNLSDSESSTPTQTRREIDVMEIPTSTKSKCNNLEMQEYFRACHENTEDSCNQSHNGDIEILGPLGLTNDTHADKKFLAQLTEKLTVEAQKNQDIIIADNIGCTHDDTITEKHLESPISACGHPNAYTEDFPVLRIKPSLNFGSQFGTV